MRTGGVLRLAAKAWSATGLVVVAVLATSATQGTPTFAESKTQRSGVLVELFTSQGCSSCPPADRLLSELAAREDLEVIALSFHVDYWNYIGWTDPFSSAAWSARQRAYGKQFGGNRIYTPQMVIDGRLEAVGSNRSTILRLIGRARTAPRRLAVEVVTEWASRDRLRARVTSTGLGALEPAEYPKTWETWVAVVENGLVTPVGRGENASKVLLNDRVVRRLTRVPHAASKSAKSFNGFEIDVEAGWVRDQLSVVAFVQDAESLQIEATAESKPEH
jgi:hypothetical protein